MRISRNMSPLCRSFVTGFVLTWILLLSKLKPSRAFAFASRSSQRTSWSSATIETTSGMTMSTSPLFATKSRTSSNSAGTPESKTPPTDKEKSSVIPMTLLSGFLGSGKTTTLKHLLENTENVKIGVIVNDVASINIDAKLVATTSQDGLVELQNGCACCSLADELLTSVQTILQRPSNNKNDTNSAPFDALVVELSGVADPVAIQNNWQAAKQKKHPATQLTELSKVITVVDASTFGTDYMTWDAAFEREGWVEDGDECAGNRKVPELLAEQVEAAQLILINKIDLAGKKQTKVASEVARGLNPNAELQEVEFGKVSSKQVLGEVSGRNEETEDAECSEPDCTDDSHAHSHSHSHTEEKATACTDPECTDESHSHSHSHDEACADPECTDESHSHSHNHDEACTDPDCTDESHSHSHSHSHSTSTDKLGIVNFVYKAKTPFETQRLMAMLNHWPIPIKDCLDLELLQEAQEQGYNVDGQVEASSPFVGVLRSKGFCWLSPTKWSGRQNDIYRHDTAMFWSHAGKHFSISSAGKWWGSISKERMRECFANDEDYARIVRDDFVSKEWGDRRQEIVFIGTNLNEDDITTALDQCLCTDKEMDSYRQRLRNYMETTVSTGASASLFDVGGTEHMEQQ